MCFFQFQSMVYCYAQCISMENLGSATDGTQVMVYNGN